MARFVGLTGTGFGQLNEHDYPLLPAGGWNILGPFSPRGTAMGETVLASPGPQAGYLNPAVLGLVNGSWIGFSGRYSSLSFAATDDLTDTPVSSFNRKSSDFDSAGSVISSGKWRISVGYSIYQNYEIPDLKLPSYYPQVYEQDGYLQRINLAVSTSLTGSLHLGFSLSYFTGDISRTVTYHYGLQDVTQTEDLDIDLEAFGFNFGVLYQAGDRWYFHLGFRPPVMLKADFKFARFYDGEKTYESSGRDSIQQPLAIILGCAFLPVEGMTLTADLSYWGWNHLGNYYYSEFYRPYPWRRRDTVKLNIGWEYLISISRKDPGYSLAIRAGYVFDSQPYNENESGWARNFLTAGLGISLKKLSLEGSAKIYLGSPKTNPFEGNTYYSNTFQLGAAYKF